jgi:hypothetical protein
MGGARAVIHERGTKPLDRVPDRPTRKHVDRFPLDRGRFSRWGTTRPVPGHDITTPGDEEIQ